MKLRSGCILWPEIYRGARPHFPKLSRDAKCDVAIIGGGISGALAAYHLVRAGISTVLVDRREVAQGSTAASTGLLQYEIDTPLVELTQKLGKERAEAAYRASFESLLAFEPLIAELGDSCGLVARPSLYLASREKDVAELGTECDARRAIQIPVEFLDRDTLRDNYQLPGHAALWSPRAYEIDPYRLTLKLIEQAVAGGLQVFEHTGITRLQFRPEGADLYSIGGAMVTAKKIVFATGYETIVELPAGLCTLSSTYAMATQPIENFAPWPQRCLIWESARPYSYIRTTEDNRAVVGGGDEDIVDAQARDALLGKKTTFLRRKIESLFPDISVEAEFAWAGTFAQTKDGLPYIGCLPQFPHCYFALGYGGNGITFSLLAAEIIRDLFLGKTSARGKLFGFDR
jgi:glycine/D-amino acid oxidase-like deaminating enzyme